MEIDGLLVQGKFVDQGPIHLVVGKPDPVVQRLIKPQNDEGSLRQLLEEIADVGAMPLLDQTASSKTRSLHFAPSVSSSTSMCKTLP